MAVDVSLPRPVSLARAAAVAARFLLAGIVAASFAARFVAALGHTPPLYFPDEYIYSGLAQGAVDAGLPHQPSRLSQT